MAVAKALDGAAPSQGTEGAPGGFPACSADGGCGRNLVEIDAMLERHHARLIKALDDALQPLYRKLDLHEADLGRLSKHPSDRRVVWEHPEESDQPVSEPTASVESRTRQGLQKAMVVAESLSGPRRSFRSSEMVRKSTARRFSVRVGNGVAFGSERSEGRLLKRMVDSSAFEFASCLLILSNAVLFGVEAQVFALSLQEPTNTKVFQALGYLYACIFTLELALRIAADARAFLCSPQRFWNAFDTVLVLASVAECAADVAAAQGHNLNLAYLRIIRICRAVRVFRVVRVLKFFASLRILVHSVFGTLKSLGWTLVLLLLILYVFGVLFTQVATQHFQEKGAQDGMLQTHYGSLQVSMYTLFQSITNGVSWAVVAEPLRQAHPFWEFVFSIFVTFTYFAVFNVVTGVFCQSAIESASRDRDMVVQAQLSMTKTYTDQLERLFQQLDVKEKGYLTLKEFEDQLEEDQVKAYFDSLDLTTGDVWNLFKLLDADASCAIDLEEFVAGCLRLHGRARSIDIHMLMYESRWTTNRVSEMMELLEAILELCTFQAGAAANGAAQSATEEGLEQWPGRSGSFQAEATAEGAPQAVRVKRPSARPAPSPGSFKAEAAAGGAAQAAAARGASQRSGPSFARVRVRSPGRPPLLTSITSRPGNAAHDFLAEAGVLGATAQARI